LVFLDDRAAPHRPGKSLHEIEKLPYTILSHAIRNGSNDPPDPTMKLRKCGNRRFLLSEEAVGTAAVRRD
jgi:hypothetical protein